MDSILSAQPGPTQAVPHTITMCSRCALPGTLQQGEMRIFPVGLPSALSSNES